MRLIRARHDIVCMKHASNVDSIPLSLYPDYTVGPGISPGLLTLPPMSSTSATSARGLGIAAITAGGELHPALRTCRVVTQGARCGGLTITCLFGTLHRKVPYGNATLGCLTCSGS